ncbi:transcription-repair coupling factor [Malonomonas rubra DSM 5091]|uniref:Transcription-repair-coupling factor n=1 Tax=Malonomonas rubra DSM 5091 TaxID=1122189 RepID=A0A1M6IJE7_MALRU|nr:transcription-repair coupling factor [Malonomonas rubra]SHJ34519.1 transcription-repair coupling factor [Malonomonas rubra DSM 5091]
MEPEFHDIKHATVKSFVDGLCSHRQTSEVLGLHGSSDAYLLARLLPEHAGLLVILTAELPQARQLAADLQFYHHRPAEIALLPNWELSPYDPLTPHPELEAIRMTTLAALARGELKVLVLPVRALMQKLIPRQVLANVALELTAENESEQEYPREQLTENLLQLGYQPVPLVEERGSFAVRGDIVDLFPADREQPVRIDFFGDWIEKMRTFDPATQRSAGETIARLKLIPSKEMILHGPFLETFGQRLKERCDELSIPRTERDAIMEEVREGLLAPGRHFLLPFNYPALDSLFSYLEKERWVLLDPPAIEQEIDSMHREVRDGEQRMLDQQQPHAARRELFLDPSELQPIMTGPGRVELSQLRVFQLDDERERYHFKCTGNAELRAQMSEGQDGLEPLAAKLQQFEEDEWRCLLVCHKQAQAQRLRELLAVHDVELNINPAIRLNNLHAGFPQLCVGELSSGFCLPEEKLAIITEEEIFGKRSHRQKKTGQQRARKLMSSLAELKENDYIVHTDHGIGQYLGLVHLQTGPVEGDFLHLLYAGGDKLYLPIDRIEKVQKYLGGEGAAPKLDKMGGQGWEKARLKARAAVEELARQLLELYAKRELRQGFAYSAPDKLYKEFEATFPHEETDDQLSAIEDTLSDMQSDKPMDRLVCGDVGYGKTEVALRAAVKAVLDSKQVAVLVPTTVLARQHWESFSQRLKDFPVRVEMVSRFRTPAENKKTLEAAAAGNVDILIGTHRILQRDVRFKDLGLVIVDEEQRFGVSHKEKLKQLRAEVDILTLTATPIPRTLHMSMAGMRDLSVIDTAPVDRLAIRTYVTRFDDELLRQAILRELRRGGQVYFIHNRVQTIDAMAEQLRELVPEASIAVGHGQMAEKELEQVMLDFIEGKSNLLLATTIVENGLDIPRANTIIVNRADCFGLSQLYQLRGRVGRSDRRAYAYLLIPGEASLTKDARERLKVLQELTELGAGFRIASHDLELRGAGDLLGAKQSGPIAAIGFELYTELLEETINKLRGLEHEEKVDPEIRLGLSAFFAEKYLPDPNQRLQFYQRMAAAESDEELFDISEELRDRYGEMPSAGEALLGTMRLRILLKKLRIELLEYDGRRLHLSFHASTKVSPDLIRKLLTEQPEKYRLGADFKLSAELGRLKEQELLLTVRKELQLFF